MNKPLARLNKKKERRQKLWGMEKNPNLEIKRIVKEHYEQLLCQEISQFRWGGKIPRRTTINKTDKKASREFE